MPISLPVKYQNDTFYMTDFFCSYNCAASYNFDKKDEKIWERYSLLNHIYCKIYNYERNIKPAPEPYYTLERFCGNLTIQEYRNMMNNEEFLLVIDKPLTRILPELHEDNDDHIISNKKLSSLSNNYSLKTRNNMTKAELLAENFNLK